MKNMPLSLQIWLVFAAITLSSSLILMVIFPWTLRDFFTREIYATIESAQNLLLSRANNELNRPPWEAEFPLNRRPQLMDARTVDHFLLIDEGQPTGSPRFPSDFLLEIRQQARKQMNDSQRYAGQVGMGKLFYVINKNPTWGNNTFLVSFMWDSYRQDLVQTLLKRLVVIMGFVFLLSWVPSLLLARYLSNPLVVLEKRVKMLTARDWENPILLERNDEIGRLGQSIEQLRQQLIQHEADQQSFLQNVSHELKTPVMIIGSYAKAIRDGIFPKGSLVDTVEVIEEETERLQGRIHNLLYLTKLDYLSNYTPVQETIELDKLIDQVADKFSWRRSELDWSLALMPLIIIGNPEQWHVVLENLFDNQVRYAESRVHVSLKPNASSDGERALLRIWNDGPAMDQGTLEHCFDKFRKGQKGKYGLGLTIVKRIVSLHQAKIWVENEVGGVAFCLEIPTALSKDS